ncbi:MAG: hypothetical protein ABW042_02580 [Phenylobacterium sp.]
MGLFDRLSGRRARDRFAARVMAAVEARGWRGEVDYDPAGFQIGLGGGRLRLAEPFSDFRRGVGRGRERVVAALAELALQVAEPPATLAEAAPRLRPELRRLIHIGDAWVGAAPWEAAAARRGVYQRVTGGLAAMAVLDHGAASRPVTDDDLTRWRAGLFDVLDAALANLRAAGGPSGLHRTPAGYWASRWADGCDAARLLLPDLVKALPLKGTPLAVPLARDCLLVAGLDDAPAIAALVQRAERRLRRPAGLLSAVPLTLTPGGWRPYEGRDADDPLARLAHRARLRDWSDQAALLKANMPAGLEAAYVCEVEGDTANGRLVTRATLAPDASNFVPLVDQLLVAGGGRRPVIRSLSQVAAAVERPLYRVDRAEPPRLVIMQPFDDQTWGRMFEPPSVGPHAG